MSREGPCQGVTRHIRTLPIHRTDMAEVRSEIRSVLVRAADSSNCDRAGGLEREHDKLPDLHSVQQGPKLPDIVRRGLRREVRVRHGVNGHKLLDDRGRVPEKAAVPIRRRAGHSQEAAIHARLAAHPSPSTQPWERSCRITTPTTISPAQWLTLKRPACAETPPGVSNSRSTGRGPLWIEPGPTRWPGRWRYPGCRGARRPAPACECPGWPGAARQPTHNPPVNGGPKIDQRATNGS